MTCIVGLVEKTGAVWLGGDSASGNTGTYHVNPVRAPKVFRRGALVFGFTSSWRMGQLLQFRLPELEPRPDLPEWLATTFVDAVRKTLLDGGYAKKENNVEQAGEFLLGVRGRLFVFDSDFHVGEPADPYAACGCGQAYALGALHATRSFTNWAPRNRLRTALEAAASYSAYVRAPWRFVHTTRCE